MTQQENNLWAKDIATTIIAQLGGNQFATCTGASKFVYAYNGGDPFVMFNIGKNKNNIKKVRVTYQSGLDTYKMDFIKTVTHRPIKNHPEVVYHDFETAYSHDDVYCDTLQQVFTEQTGLVTRIF